MIQLFRYNGSNGKEALVYSVLYRALSLPQVGLTGMLTRSYFNRTPEVGEPVTIFVEYNEKSFITTAEIVSVSAFVTAEYTSVEEITGAQGPQGPTGPTGPKGADGADGDIIIHIYRI